jgi:hypothetical protein
VTRRVLGWTGAVGAMVLLVVGMASMKDGPDEHPAPPPPAPKLVAVVDGNVVVLGSDTGEVERTIAEGDPEGDVADVTVSPDGLDVYFTRLGNGECAAGEIVRVPIGGGNEEVVSRGSDPRISPDGRTLAYEGLSPEDVCPPLPYLVVRDLDTGDEHTWFELLDDTGQVADYQPPSAVIPLAWAPDARVLAVRLEFGPAPSRLIAVDTQGRTRFLLTDSAPLPLDPEMRPIAYRPNGELVAIDGTTIVLVDPVTGEINRTVIEAGAPIADAWSTGRRIAYAVEGETGTWVLTPDDNEPRRLDVEVESAAWLP